MSVAAPLFRLMFPEIAIGPGSSFIARLVQKPRGSMKTWRRSLLYRTFHAGIILKGLDGALEVLGGLLLWFSKPGDLNEIVRFLLQHDLSRDPHDWIAEHLMDAAAKTADANPVFASFFLLSHGVTKVALVLGLWMKKLWAYPLTIAVFAAFCVYQTYRYALTHSAWMLVLTILDLALIYLTWEQYRQQKRLRRAKRGSDL